ncbi:uncharacterized protein HaLaN_22478, partial [Haematococcus lacustris]
MLPPPALQWTIMGFDCCIHLAEETVDAERSASWGLVAGVGSACLLGLLLMLSLTFSMQSLDSIMDPNAAAGGQAIAQA